MKNSRDVIHQRRNEIVRELQDNGTMQVSVLSDRLNVTTATIRRDLTEMEREGIVVRSFGGAALKLVENMEEIEPTNIEDEKEMVRRRIAKAAAGLVEDGDVLFLNSSATASLVLEYLSGKSVTALTNNARIINRKLPKNSTILLMGGEIYGKKQSLIGPFALDTISKVVASKCILGVSGISAESGLTSVILAETQINMLMIKKCKGDIIVVADGSKVGITQNFNTGDLKNITYLITDNSADPSSLKAIQESGVKVIVV